MSELKVVTIGTSGHSGEVMTQVGATDGFKMAGLAAVYDAEDCGGLKAHPACPETIEVFDNYQQLLDTDVLIGLVLEHYLRKHRSRYFSKY